MRRRTSTAGGALLSLVAATVAITAADAAERSEQTATAARTVGVTVGDNFYSPTRLSVSPGTKVRWTWRGRNRHDVVVGSGPTRFSSPVKRSGTFSRTLTRTGTYKILCTIHGQRMRIKVD